MAARRALAVPALVVLLGLGACSSDAPEGGGSTQTTTPVGSTESVVRPGDGDAFVGSWAIELYEGGGLMVTGDEMRQQGRDMIVTVRDDGTFTMTAVGDGAPEPAEGTWVSTGGAGAVFTMEGSGVDVTLDGDRLTFTGEDRLMTFARS